jgi:hypothetical protein
VAVGNAGGRCRGARAGAGDAVEARSCHGMVAGTASLQRVCGQRLHGETWYGVARALVCDERGTAFRCGGPFLSVRALAIPILSQQRVNNNNEV